MSQTSANKRWFLCALCLLCSPCTAQPEPPGDGHAAVVNAIGLGLEPQSSTDAVVITRFADFAVQPGLQVDQKLFEGDMLQGDRQGLLIELRCAGGSLIKLSGRFRVAINARRPGQDCAFNLLAGGIDVVTDRPTEVNAGGRIMGSEGTRYSVDTAGDSGSPSVSLTVFEGAVSLRGPGPAQRIVQMTTIALENKSSKVEPTAIPDAKLQQHARLLAEFDSIKAMQSYQREGLKVDAEATARYFTQLNEAVLRSPGNAEARLDLAAAQVAIDRPEGARYNTKRLGVGDLRLDESAIKKIRQDTIRFVPPSGRRSDWLIRQQPELKQQLDRYRAQQEFNRGAGG